MQSEDDGLGRREKNKRRKGLRENQERALLMR
jgi:hypothetical protein